MTIDLLLVPYDSGHHGVRMGRGPLYLVERGLPAALEADGHHVRVRRIEARMDPPTEIGVAFELARRLSDAVAGARDRGRFPLVLAGNCFSAVGTVAGVGPARTGVLWLDAHADLNTPETTPSGFLDGMAAATLLGHCWSGVAATVRGFAPIESERFVLVGSRDLDPGEEALLRSSAIQRPGIETLRRDPHDAVDRVATALGRDVDRFYLHVDLDVLDPAVARVNRFAAEGGLLVADVVAIAAAAARHHPLAAAALTALDPDLDADGRAATAATTIARGIVAA